MKTTPLAELENRFTRCRNLLNLYLPEAQGLFVFSRINLYYFTGTYPNGMLWFPIDGEPVLFCRKGIERAEIESPLKNILPFNSYADIAQALNKTGYNRLTTIAAEMNGLSWSLSNSFQKHLSGYKFISGDRVIAMTRAKKSEAELAIIREAGKRHSRCLTEILPPLLHIGMTELEIAHTISNILFSLGHHGIQRMTGYGEEVYLGHISIGESANYPSVFNGPVGLRGMHPITPFMGSDEIRWMAGQPLTVDHGFNLDGYHTDKTQIYWPGQKNSIPDPIQKAHDFCIEIQQTIAKALRPGAIPSQLWLDCLESAKLCGFSEGFMGLGGNKVRFMGHGIGLAIDEYPVIAKGFDLPVEQGMVIALEPKIGIQGVGMVGVENTFEVTQSGGKSLTGDRFDIISIDI